MSQLAFAVAAGAESLWGLPLIPGGGPVLIYSAEDTLDDWKRKGGAVLNGHGEDFDWEKALERFYVIDHSEGLARLSEVVTVRSGPAGESVSQRVARPTEEQDRLISAAQSINAKFILVETASRLVEDEDNANFSALQSSLGRIGRETGAAVVVSHHATKAASKDNDSAIESARGGGALIFNARNALSLFPADADMVKTFEGRFPADDIVTLFHGKPTSSSRRNPPSRSSGATRSTAPSFACPRTSSTPPIRKPACAPGWKRPRRRSWIRSADCTDWWRTPCRPGRPSPRPTFASSSRRKWASPSTASRSSSRPLSSAARSR